MTPEEVRQDIFEILAAEGKTASCLSVLKATIYLAAKGWATDNDLKACQTFLGFFQKDSEFIDAIGRWYKSLLSTAITAMRKKRVELPLWNELYAAHLLDFEEITNYEF